MLEEVVVSHFLIVDCVGDLECRVQPVQVFLAVHSMRHDRRRLVGDGVDLRHQALDPWGPARLRGGLGSASCITAIKGSRQLYQLLPRQGKLGEDVRRISFSGDFPKVNTSRPDSLLNPQRVGVQVA